MPSDSDAVAIRINALGYFQSHITNQALKANLPQSITNLKPIRVKEFDGGF